MSWFRWGRSSGNAEVATQPALPASPLPVEVAPVAEAASPAPEFIPPVVAPPVAEVTHRQFTAANAALLNFLYWEAETPLDSLPYTPAFENLYGHFLLKTGLSTSRHSVWRALMGYRKAGKLQRPDDLGDAGEEATAQESGGADQRDTPSQPR